MNKDKIKKMIGGKKEAKEAFIGIVGSLIVLVVFAFIFVALGDFWNKGADDKYKSVAVDGTIDGIKFTEAKCLIGSIFYKDSIILSPDDIEIDKLSLFGEKKTVYPYHTIKEITFSKSFNGYKVVINYPSSFFGRTALRFILIKRIHLIFWKMILKIIVKTDASLRNLSNNGGATWRLEL